MKVLLVMILAFSLITNLSAATKEQAIDEDKSEELKKAIAEIKILEQTKEQKQNIEKDIFKTENVDLQELLKAQEYSSSFSVMNNNPLPNYNIKNDLFNDGIDDFIKDVINDYASITTLQILFEINQERKILDLKLESYANTILSDIDQVIGSDKNYFTVDLKFSKRKNKNEKSKVEENTSSYSKLSQYQLEAVDGEEEVSEIFHNVMDYVISWKMVVTISIIVAFFGSLEAVTKMVAWKAINK